MITKNDSNFPEHNPIIQAQRFFLQKAVELKPEIVDDLRDLASVEYSKFSASLQLSQMTFNKKSIRMPVVKIPKWTELAAHLNAINLRQLLLTWADRWNLNAEWCLDHGLKLLDDIYHSNISQCIFGEEEDSSSVKRQADRKMFFSERIENLLSIEFLETILKSQGDLPPPPPHWPEWNPIREKRQAYIQRAIQGALNAIEADPYLSALNKGKKRGLVNSVVNIAEQYCNRIEERKKQAKIQPIKLSRNIERNLLWSVKFQVAGMTYSAIADEYIATQKPKSRQAAKRRMGEGVDITTVKRSVEQTLKLLGLRKRSNSGPGRPLHAKDSHSAKIRRQLGVN